MSDASSSAVCKQSLSAFPACLQLSLLQMYLTAWVSLGPYQMLLVTVCSSHRILVTFG